MQWAIHIDYILPEVANNCDTKSFYDIERRTHHTKIMKESPDPQSSTSTDEEKSKQTTILEDINPDQQARQSPVFAITLIGISKHYRGTKRDVWALRDINLRIEPGIFGLLGRNGAGKTTLLQIIATLLNATDGSVSIGHYDTRRDRWAIRHHLGYLPQEHGFHPTLTVAETLCYLATLSGIHPAGPAIVRVLEAVNLTDRTHSRVGSLSGGMRRRLGLAQALLGDPSVLVVDEPTAGLDPVEQQRFRMLLGTLGAQGNRTIILSTHVVEDVAICARRLAVLEQGRLLFQGFLPDLTAYARGQVWLWRTNVETIEAARKDRQMIVTSITPVEDPALRPNHLVDARVVGGQPDPTAVEHEPTLEDGYFALLGEMRGGYQ
jgi:ABC-2 type transport system ATP-binding protein